jgi:hypothetical protein
MKNKTYELITLIYRCFIVFFCICFTASVLGSLLVFFKVGYFEFNWKETILLSLKKRRGYRFHSWVGAVGKSEATRSQRQ